jgi:ribosomal protein S18 acetylase RimI-like enzyme
VPTKIRQFNGGDIDFALAQTTREGWDNTVETFRLCLGHDPLGCFVAEIDGERAGMVTSTRYPLSAWLGNLIVTPECRRRGVGERLMTHTIDTLTRAGVGTFRLEGDPMGISLYRRLGFVDEFVSPRYLKNPPHAPVPARADALTAADLDELRAYDRPRFGDDRGKLLGMMLAISHAAFCVRAGGELTGYAMALPSADGVRFGPCVSDDADTTARLFDAGLSAFPKVPVVMAVSEINRSAVDVMESRGFEEVPSSLRMRLGPSACDNTPETLIAIANGAMG